MSNTRPVAVGGQFKQTAFLNAYRAYVQSPPFQSPAWLRELPFDAHSDRGLALLLMAAALRGLVPDSRLGASIAGLWEHFGLDLFRLNRLPFATLQEWVSVSGSLPDHPSQKIPGVLRSCADFFFTTGSLNSWLQKAESGEAVVKTLADSIFWMGKSSAYRNKPRYALWLLHATDYPHKHLFKTAFPPVTPGHSRLISQFGDARMSKHAYSLSAPERLRYFADLMLKAGLTSPWDAVAANEAFLERAGTLRFTCQSRETGCRECPLRAFCPTGKRQGPGKEKP